MRIHHKDGVTTDWAEQPAVFSGQLFICGMNLSKNWIQNFYREYIGYSWRQSTVTDGGCKYNTSWTRNSRTNTYDKRLRNIVHDFKHILNNAERNVNNCVNDATHADELTMQHWAHCTQSVVASSDVFTSSHWLKADLICLFTSIPSMHMCLRPWVLFSSFSPSTSCSTSPSFFSCFFPWRTTTPWTWTPCAASLTGPSSPWTIACPTQVQDQRCQSGPSARNSFVPSEGRFSKNYGTDQKRLQVSDPHFDKFTTSATFACWKIRFKTEVCTCSQFPTEATLWIKEVELVDSVDDLKSSRSVRGIQMPNSEALDAKIASALDRIIHNTQFKRKVSLEEKNQKEDRFLRGRKIAYLIYEYFQVTGANDSVDNYADLFKIVLRNDDIKEFDSNATKFYY